MSYPGLHQVPQWKAKSNNNLKVSWAGFHKVDAALGLDGGKYGMSFKSHNIAGCVLYFHGLVASHCMYPLNLYYIISIKFWKEVTLLHESLCGYIFIYFNW